MLFTSFYEKSFIIHKMFKEALKGILFTSKVKLSMRQLWTETLQNYLTR